MMLRKAGRRALLVLGARLRALVGRRRPMMLSKDRRRALLVLGMHRSGTSALARILVLAGASPPSGLMPATEDNASGYWESMAITRFNNRLLAKAGLRWSDRGSIPLTWFHEAEREEDRRDGAGAQPHPSE